MASVAAAPFDAGKATTPDQPAGRISSLDFIRGIAVVGILWANIVGYARPREAYRWQAIFYEPDWTDNAVWLFQYVFVDGKLRGLFALLFGAGIVLFLERARAKGASGHWLQFRRLAWLALFGLAHYFVLYAGDILFHYAVLGMIAMWAAFWRVRVLLIVGALLYCADSVPASVDLGGYVQWETQARSAPPGSEIRIEYEAELEQTRAQARRQGALMKGDDLGAIVAQRAARLPDFLGSTMFMAMDSLPLMLIGAALFRLGMFSGGMDRRRMIRWALIAIAVSALLHLAIGLWVAANGFLPAQNLFAMYGPAHVMRLPMIVGYAALLAAMAPSWSSGWLGRRLSAAGRMAFSNYIGTSLVMALIFQGWALGLFDRFDRVGLLGFVALGAVLMLGWSQPWLARFRYGPLEWLWRCLTYWKLFPIRREAAA
jgi:uncharacterized protein